MIIKCHFWGSVLKVESISFSFFETDLEPDSQFNLQVKKEKKNLEKKKKDLNQRLIIFSRLFKLTN